MTELHPDLFGGETPVKEPAKSPIQERKKQLQYHEAQEGEGRCKNCKNLIKIRHRNRNYYKCELIGDSRSEATDIRLKDTCNRFEEAEND